MVRAHMRFYGTVQGVGFRYTCLSFAKQLSLTGWVKNLADGSVEAVVEGPRHDLEALMAQLENHFSIREKKIEWTEAKEEFKEFFIE